MHRSRLPILDPCHERWDAMPGTRTHRHCGSCDREVIDLSAMHAEAAIDTLLARDGRVCVRYKIDSTGHLRFAPPPPTRPAAPLLAALMLTACAGWDSEPETVVPGELGMCTPEQELAGACEPTDPPPIPKAEPIDWDEPPCDLPKPASDRSPRNIPLDVLSAEDPANDRSPRNIPLAVPSEDDVVLRADDYGDDLMGVIVRPQRRELKQIKRETRLERRMQRRARRLGQ